jgi:hypothetical protein
VLLPPESPRRQRAQGVVRVPSCHRTQRYLTCKDSIDRRGSVNLVLRDVSESLRLRNGNDAAAG